MCAAQNVIPHVFPYHLPSYILRQGLSLTGSLLIQLDWLANGPHGSSGAEATGICINAGLFHKAARDQTEFFVLDRQTLY